MDRITVFDTTLRDGAQMEGITFSLEDKREIISLLDNIGVDFIEGGMPASNPTDRELFSTRTELKNSKMVAFGSTRKPGVKAEKDANMKALAESCADWVCIFGKAWDFHVTEVLKITKEENLELIRDSVSFLIGKGKHVIFDAEHYFDGYASDREYAVSVVRTASEAGAEWVTLCDSNGGSLPSAVSDAVTETLLETGANLGIHCHNDSDLAVACTLAAVDAGAEMVQVTVNGFGERCGNANMCSVLPDLVLKMGCEVSADITQLTQISHAVSEIANMTHNSFMPYVGSKSFTHKGGMHIDAMLKNTETYEHVSPESVGNHRNILVSEMSGKAGIVKKLEEMGIEPTEDHVSAILSKIKELEGHGYQFEAADASLELLIRKICGVRKTPFEIPGFRIYIDEIGDNEIKSEASVKVIDADGNMEHTASDGDGPVDAINNALKKALAKFFPKIDELRLIDYKVRVLDERAATAAPVRVMIRTTDGKSKWTTVGVSTNVIEASLIALVDSMEYAVSKDSWTV